MTPKPPPRAPHWIAIEQGWSTDPCDCAQLAVDGLCLAARPPADFVFEGQPLTIHRVEAVTSGARVVGACGGTSFVLELAARSDGWVEGVLSVDGQAALSFFLERPYEEYEFFPPGHSGDAPPLEAPGRISKRLTWAQIRATDWPSFARAGYLTVETVEG